jgi:hypothetical protein
MRNLISLTSLFLIAIEWRVGELQMRGESQAGATIKEQALCQFGAGHFRLQVRLFDPIGDFLEKKG